MSVVQALYRIGRDLKRVQATDQIACDAGAMTVTPVGDVSLGMPAALGNRLRTDGASGLSLARQLLGRQNLGARGSGVVALSAATTLDATYAGKLIACTGTFTLTLPAAAAVGPGFAIEVSNAGTGKVTLTPNGSDTIRGASSLVVYTREGGVLVSDGTSWQAIGFEPVVVTLSVTDNSGVIRLSNGVTEQWGTGSSADVAITFPLAFTSKPLVLVSYIAAVTSATLESVNASDVRLAGADFRGRYSQGGAIMATGDLYNWYAKGVI